MIDVEVLRTALDPSSMDVPKQVRNAFEKAARVKSFVTVPGGAALIRGSVLIAVYGDAPRVSTAARALRVPDEGVSHTQRTRQRGAYAAVAFAAARDSDPPSVAARTAGWTVREPLMQGKALRHHIDRSAEEREMDEFMPVSGHLAAFASDMVILGTMWLFGGSDAWPIGRIAAEWDRNAEAVRALPGYSDA